MSEELSANQPGGEVANQSDDSAVTQAQVSESEETAVATQTPQTGADFYQPRTIILSATIKGKEVEFTHKTTRLSDKIWLGFNDDLNPRQVLENKELIYREDEETAVRNAYKAAVVEIPAGYQPFFKQELTAENFHSLIPLADQRAVIEKIFAHDVSESAAGEFFFDEQDASNLFEIDVPVNGEVITGEVALKPKTAATNKLFKEANQPGGAKVKRFRDANYSVKLNFTKIVAIFDTLSEAVGNFANNEVPIWLKVALVSYYYNEFAQTETKN